jgi:peroxiredoxin Q/BCP
MGLLSAGDIAPDFCVKSHTGEDVKLSDFRGKSVLLWFYPKADTPGCTKEGCSFRDKKAEFGKKDVEILGVSFDTIEENKAFAEKFDFNFPLLCDTKREIGLAYGACDDASAPNAKRISYLIAPDGKIKYSFGKVDALSHPQEALAML